MLVFECPACKAKMQASEEYAGKTTMCPGCGAQAKIPSNAPADAITADPDNVSAPASKPDAITTPDQARPSKKSRNEDADDRDVRRPRQRDSGGSGTGTAAAVGMSVGMIVLIVVVVGGCAVVGVGAILIALLVPAVQKVREAAARAQTTNNMKQVSIAMHAHHDQHKKLPSPKHFTQQGMKHVDLSWRVTVLPFVEQGMMFQQIDQSSSWDHGNNLQFANRRPNLYENLTRPEGDKTQTTFQFFTGPNTMYPDPQRSPRLTDITDGTSNTFQFAEAQTSVQWLRPLDMVVPQNGELPLPKDRFLAAFADGTVRMIDRSKMNDVTLRGVIQHNDGQMLPLDF